MLEPTVVRENWVYNFFQAKFQARFLLDDNDPLLIRPLRMARTIVFFQRHTYIHLHFFPESTYVAATNSYILMGK